MGPGLASSTILGIEVKCKFNLFMRDTLVDEKEAQRQDAAEAHLHKTLYSIGRRNHFAKDPVIQLLGPVRPIVPLCDPGNAQHHRR